MDMEAITFLNKFYQNLYDSFEREKKTVYEHSLIISFLKIKSNDRYRLLVASSIPGYKIPKHILNYLKHNNFIRDTSELGTYCISAKGIWEIEKKRETINDVKLVEYLDNDEKFFNLFKFTKKNISDKHKVVLLSMLAARSWSEYSPIDLKRGDATLDAMNQIMDDAYDLLRSFKIILKLKKEDLYGKPGNEHKVSNVFRHTDELPKLTGGIYHAMGDQKYYLSLYDGEKVSKEKLRYLFKRLFGDKNYEISELEKINDFCNKIVIR